MHIQKYIENIEGEEYVCDAYQKICRECNRKFGETSRQG